MQTITAAVNAPDVKEYPIYAPAGEELRIEMVYQARRNIRPVAVDSAEALRGRLPMILMTHEYAGERLPASFVNEVDTVSLGEFDCNRRPKGTRRHSPLFIYRLTLLKERPDSIPGKND